MSSVGEIEKIRESVRRACRVAEIIASASFEVWAQNRAEQCITHLRAALSALESLEQPTPQPPAGGSAVPVRALSDKHQHPCEYVRIEPKEPLLEDEHDVIEYWDGSVPYEECE